MAYRRIENIRDAFFDDYSVAWAYRFGTPVGTEGRIRYRLISTALARIRALDEQRLWRELTDAWYQFGHCIRTWYRTRDTIEPRGGRIEVARLWYLYAYALWIQGPRFAELNSERRRGRTRQSNDHNTSRPHRAENIVHRYLRRVDGVTLDILAEKVLAIQRVRLGQTPYSSFYHLGITVVDITMQFMPELEFIRRVLE